MTTSVSPAVIPPEIFENINGLHEQVGNLQRELQQALAVWQSTLEDEKKTFDELLKHKELAWQEQEGQWARQSQAYEERLSELKADFETRLKQAEQNAARALTELDDAWQRDKLEWGPGAQQKWPEQRRELEAKTQALEERLFALEGARETERARLQARIDELESRPEPATPAAVFAEPSPAPLATPDPASERLQSQLLEFQKTVASLQGHTSGSDEVLNACLQAMDYQISMLSDIIQQQALPPAAEDGPSSLVQS